MPKGSQGQLISNEEEYCAQDLFIFPNSHAAKILTLQEIRHQMYGGRYKLYGEHKQKSPYINP